MKKKKPDDSRMQFGALPYRRTPDGGLEILLITSRETRRWVIPKGWPMKKLASYAAAAREAYEEAGLAGAISREPLGRFTYEKRLKSRDYVPCEVEVFVMEVRQEAKRWPERDERERRWFQPEAAARRVEEGELAEMILDLPRHLAEKMAAHEEGDDRFQSESWNLSHPASA